MDYRRTLTWIYSYKMDIYWLVLVIFVSSTYGDLAKKTPFPENFLFGVSTAAFQVEGGTKLDDKAESIWDKFTKDQKTQNGSLTADSYRNATRDVELLRQLGVDFYKFSISWSRVMPTGFPNKIKEDGIEYYNDLLILLDQYNIDAMVVMYHYDLPQPLQDLGGWANPEIITWFSDYAKVLLDRFNGKVKYWITINDPVSFCYNGYSGNAPPGLYSKGIGDYMCIKNMLVSHGKVYRLFEKNYKKKNQMGFAMELNTYIPLDYNLKDESHKETTLIIHQFAYHIFLHPIFGKEGDFPKELKKLIEKRSKYANFPRSRLPPLSKEEIKMLKGASDFLGINHMTSFEVSAKNKPVGKFPDVYAEISQKDTWIKSVSQDIKLYPYGLYYMWFILHKAYGPIDIFISELGWPTGPGLDDKERVLALREYLKSLLYILQDAGGRVKGLAVRSLVDGFEWPAGTSERYGLYEVDFASPNKTRLARSSAMFYRHVIESHSVEEQWVYKDLNLGFSTRRTSKRKTRKEEDELLKKKVREKTEFVYKSNKTTARHNDEL